MKLQPARPGFSGHLRQKLAELVRALGSLRLAVPLLLFLASVLVLGTLVESWQGRSTAAQLVYQTWWFACLLGLLAANIFCAAGKKWPFRRHQTGFLITHAGLLTLIAGGLADSVAGSTGVMNLVTPNGAQLAEADSQLATAIVDRSAERIRVRRPRRGRADVLDEAFSPGPLAWDVESDLDPRAGDIATFLNWVRSPWPAGWSRDLGEGARLELLRYYPHCRREPFTAAPESANEFAVPAAMVQLASPTTGMLPPRWIANSGAYARISIGPGRIEFLGQSLSAEQVAEFRNPPSAIGSNGQIVIGLGAAISRIDLTTPADAKPISLGGSGWSVRAVSATTAANQQQTVFVELNSPDGRQSRLAVSGHRPGIWRIVSPASGLVPPEGFWVWHQLPPVADESTRAVLQFATGADGRLSFRSYRGSKGQALAFETSGNVEPGAAAPWQRIWAGMDWQFRVITFLPRAAAGLNCILADRPASVLGDVEIPAIYCRLNHGRATSEFWLTRGDGEMLTLNAGGEPFEIGYYASRIDLGFELSLLRAEQTIDPASGKPTGLSSQVLLNDPSRGIRDEAHTISLNQPLAYRGYRIYQGGIAPLGRDDSGKPAYRVQLLANRDPGVWLKYAGSAMIALGIACMFYMRAYFFKRREPARMDS